MFALNVNKKMKTIQVDILKKFMSEDEMNQMMEKYRLSRKKDIQKWIPKQEDIDFVLFNPGLTLESFKERFGLKDNGNALRKIGQIVLYSVKK